VGSIRENPTPKEGVAAWHENKETTLGKGRETGRASCSPRAAKKAKDPSPQIQPSHGQRWQEEAHKKAEAAPPHQGQNGGQTQVCKKAGYP